MISARKYLLVTGVLVCGVVLSPCEAADVRAWTFTVNGRPADLTVASLAGTPDAPQSGDAGFLGPYAIVLPPPGRYDLRLTPDGLARGGGKGALVVAHVRTVAGGRIHDPLLRLNDTQRARLWGVRLDAWHKGLETTLKTLTLSQACVVISESISAGIGRRLPPLPRDLQYLVIEPAESPALDDLSAFAALTKLKMLKVSIAQQAPLNPVIFRNAKDLRYLDVSAMVLRDAKPLGELTALRWLDLAWCEGVADFEWTRSLVHLRRLELQHSDAFDLSGLSGAKSLEGINAYESLAAVLPAGRIKSLKALTIMSTRVSDTDATAFARANPQCRVLHRWKAALTQAVREVDRVEVRTGPDAAQDTVLAFAREPAAITGLLAAIEISEKRSGGFMQGAGFPVFRFYGGRRLLASITMHKYQVLRWPGGWPGDAMLTPKSADAVCTWLAAHGVPAPQRERKRMLRDRAAADHRLDLYNQFIPPGIRKAMAEAAGPQEVQATFEKGIPDGVQRAAMYLRLFGCDEARWIIYNRVDDLLRKQLLPTVTTQQIDAAIRRGVSDPMVLTGAARWLLGERQWVTLPAPYRKALLPALARYAMAHPRSESRRAVLAALKLLGGPEAVSVLGAVLAGKISPRSVPPEQAGDPGSIVVVPPPDEEMPADCSDAACAAMILARLGDKSALPTIRKRLETASGSDKALLQKAIKVLTTPTKRGG